MKRVILFAVVFFSCLFFSTATFAQVDLYLDKLNVYVTSYGKIQFYTLPDTTEQIDRISILVASGPSSVFDYDDDQDIEDSTTLIQNPQIGDYEIYGSYNNNYSGLPPNILLKQSVYCWQSQNAVLIKYTIVNRESSTLDAIVGFNLIPQVEDDYSGGDTVTYSSTDKIISVRKTEAVGFKALSENFKSANVFVYNSDYKTDTTYYKLLTYSSIDTFFTTDPNDPNVDDPVIIPALNSKSLAAGDSMTFYMAVGYGASEAEMKAGIAQVETEYNSITAIVDNKNIRPSSFSLYQNYPNPFNPSTVISFNLPYREFVSLKIFNALGQEVKGLINKELEAGQYSYKFDAGGLTSGIYFYNVTAGTFTQTKKMILLK